MNPTLPFYTVGFEECKMAFSFSYSLDFLSIADKLWSERPDFITVARNGKPVAKISLIDETPVSRRIGIAKGRFTIKGDFDSDNDAIAELMMGGTL